MTRKSKNSNAPGEVLSPEDRRLWDNTARTIQPLDDNAGEGTGTPKAACEEKPLTTDEASKKVVQDDFMEVARSPAPPGSAVGLMDRRQQRRIARGMDSIDSTLDLHGLTQEQAYSRLHSHLRRASESGQRRVLVITGKGKGAGRGATGDGGVLRRNLPHWLAAGELTRLVSGIAPAGPRHGGEGAFYVRLKRKKAHKPE